MASYRISPNAEADLERIWLYGLTHWGVEAADRYHLNFFEHFETLASQPFLYPVSDIRDGYRRSVCGVFYRLNGKIVEIMAIIGKQELDEWL